MIVMPANATGWFWHVLARETGRIGHLYSPGANISVPFPWFPYALDNGAFSCWDRSENTFDESRWLLTYPKWLRLLDWARSATLRPRWAVVPDVPGNAEEPLRRWEEHRSTVVSHGIEPALAVQDGMVVGDVLSLRDRPSVIAIGGSDEFKWGSVESWCRSFSRVHVLRVNSPTRLSYLEGLGCESCDGTGWNRGNRRQTSGLEEWARRDPRPFDEWVSPYVCRQQRGRQRQWAF